MPVELLHVGDAGTAVVVQVVEEDSDGVLQPTDISTATTKQIKLKNPSTGVTLTKTATLKTDGLDGRMKFNSLAADFLNGGPWPIQIRIVIPGAPAWDGHSDKGTIQVYENL